MGSKCTNPYWYYRHLYVFQLFRFVSKILLLLLLFNFQLYFQFLIFFHRVWNQNLEWEKVVIIYISSIYDIFYFLDDIFLSPRQYSPKKRGSFTKCKFLYFIKVASFFYTSFNRCFFLIFFYWSLRDSKSP